MTKTKWALVALVSIALASAWAYAQQGQEARPRRQGPRAERQRRGPAASLDQMYERWVKQLDLTAEQQTQIKQILDTHRQDVENWTKQHGAEFKLLREQLAKARKDKDTDAIKTLREKMAQAGKERNELRARMQKQVMGVLDDKQKEKFQQMLRQRRQAQGRVGMNRAAFRQLDLTAEQRSAIDKIFKTAAQDARKAQKPEDKGAVWKKAYADSVNLLTPEQKASLQKLQARQGQRRGPLAGLKLTEEQNEKVTKIWAEAREKARDAERADRRAILQEAMEKIKKEVLTPEQREELQKLQERRRTGRQGQGQRRQNRGGQARQR